MPIIYARCELRYSANKPTRHPAVNPHSIRHKSACQRPRGGLLKKYFCSILRSISTQVNKPEVKHLTTGKKLNDYFENLAFQDYNHPGGRGENGNLPLFVQMRNGIRANVFLFRAKICPFRAKIYLLLSKGLPYSAKFHGKWLHCIHITKPCHAGTTILIRNRLAGSLRRSCGGGRTDPSLAFR